MTRDHRAMMLPPVQVCDGLFRGPFPDEELLEIIEARGITTIITLCDEEYAAEQIKKECGRRSFRHVHIPLNAFVSPTERQIEKFLAVVDARSQSAVYVHCIYGKDRTGTMIGIFRLSQGWSYQDTLGEMQKFGFGMEYSKLLNAIAAFAKRSERL